MMRAKSSGVAKSGGRISGPGSKDSAVKAGRISLPSSIAQGSSAGPSKVGRIDRTSPLQLLKQARLRVASQALQDFRNVLEAEGAALQAVPEMQIAVALVLVTSELVNSSGSMSISPEVVAAVAAVVTSTAPTPRAFSAAKQCLKNPAVLLEALRRFESDVEGGSVTKGRVDIAQSFVARTEAVPVQMNHPAAVHLRRWLDAAVKYVESTGIGSSAISVVTVKAPPQRAAHTTPPVAPSARGEAKHHATAKVHPPTVEVRPKCGLPSAKSLPKKDPRTVMKGRQSMASSSQSKVEQPNRGASSCERSSSPPRTPPCKRDVFGCVSPPRAVTFGEETCADELDPVAALFADPRTSVGAEVLPQIESAEKYQSDVEAANVEALAETSEEVAPVIQAQEDAGIEDVMGILEIAEKISSNVEVAEREEEVEVAEEISFKLEGVKSSNKQDNADEFDAASSSEVLAQVEQPKEAPAQSVEEDQDSSPLTLCEVDANQVVADGQKLCIHDSEIGAQRTDRVIEAVTNSEATSEAPLREEHGAVDFRSEASIFGQDLFEDHDRSPHDVSGQAGLAEASVGSPSEKMETDSSVDQTDHANVLPVWSPCQLPEGESLADELGQQSHFDGGVLHLHNVDVDASNPSEASAGGSNSAEEALGGAAAPHTFNDSFTEEEDTSESNLGTPTKKWVGLAENMAVAWSSPRTGSIVKLEGNKRGEEDNRVNELLVVTDHDAPKPCEKASLCDADSASRRGSVVAWCITAEFPEDQPAAPEKNGSNLDVESPHRVVGDVSVASAEEQEETPPEDAEAVQGEAEKDSEDVRVAQIVAERVRSEDGVETVLEDCVGSSSEDARDDAHDPRLAQQFIHDDRIEAPGAGGVVDSQDSLASSACLDSPSEPCEGVHLSNALPSSPKHELLSLRAVEISSVDEVDRGVVNAIVDNTGPAIVSTTLRKTVTFDESEDGYVKTIMAPVEADLTGWIERVDAEEESSPSIETHIEQNPTTSTSAGSPINKDLSPGTAPVGTTGRRLQVGSLGVMVAAALVAGFALVVELAWYIGPEPEVFA
eukprot:TRINITY_DN3341_c0_g1_i1.p1 TRINITY_DN3341_c0_g1~~TRINITY_DN3341_c0_g1_i1.p1  ORF type:complete len:1056 (-),score=224.70 TRINITY_DN3341_c0_g1_i1:194-3361(-)